MLQWLPLELAFDLEGTAFCKEPRFEPGWGLPPSTHFALISPSNSTPFLALALSQWDSLLFLTPAPCTSSGSTFASYLPV